MSARRLGLLGPLIGILAVHAARGNGGGAILAPPRDLLQIAPGSVETLLHGVHVKSVVAGPDGALWAATLGNGLAHRRPGASAWTYLTSKDGRLPSDSVHRVCLHEGRLWIGFAGDGAARMVGSTLERFTAARGTLPDDHVNEMVSFRGQLWVLTDRGLAVLEGERFRPVSPAGPGFPRGLISALSVGHDGRLWVGSEQAEIAAHDGRSWVRHDFLGRVPGRIIRCVAPVDDRVWFGTYGSLNAYNEKTARLDDETVEKPALFPTRIITCIHRTGDTALVGTGGAGLYRFEIAGAFWRLYNEQTGLPSGHINSVTVVDRQVLVATVAGIGQVDLARPLPVPTPSPTVAPAPAPPGPAPSPTAVPATVSPGPAFPR